MAEAVHNRNLLTENGGAAILAMSYLKAGDASLERIFGLGEEGMGVFVKGFNTLKDFGLAVLDEDVQIYSLTEAGNVYVFSNLARDLSALISNHKLDDRQTEDKRDFSDFINI